MNWDLAIVWQHRDLLVDGFAHTIVLTVVTAAAALALGTVLAAMLRARSPILARISQGYVDTMRCIPFLLFAYLLYYGLPALGIRMSGWNTGLLALVVYNTAYMAEILRSAWAGTVFRFD